MIKEIDFIEMVKDTTFKYLYKNEKYRPWFNEIIKNKFNIDLSDYKLVDNEENTGNRVKDYRLDIKLEKDNKIVIIEMNKDYYDFVDSKNYQYLYRVAGSIYDTGEKYRDKEVKLILFNNFKNNKLPEIKTGNFKLRDIDNNLIIEDIESYEIYLPNYKEICYHKVNKEDVSLSLMTCTSYEEMRKKTNNPKDLEIIKELERLAMDDIFKNLYDEEKVYEKTQNSIKEEMFNKGKEQGIEQRNIEIVKNMILLDISYENISKVTGLSIEEIKKIDI